MPVSRYKNTNIFSTDEGKQYIGTFKFPKKEDLDKIPSIQIRISNFERLDQLAFKHLGSGEYWWVIALMNDIDHAFNFEEGQILRIPIDVQEVLKLV